MGQTLSEPVFWSTTQEGGDDRYLYAVSECQGWRITMEDSHTSVLDLDGTKDSNAFFAVYDGHGGARVSKYAGENVHTRLVTEESYKKKQYRAALKDSFLGTDADIRNELPRERSGCTAVAALFTNDGKLLVANAGDSRSVLSVKGKAKPLSIDHKPGNTEERARILAAGGYVEYGRVNGNLALSRAIGDFEYKRNKSLTPEAQIITSDPEIMEHDIDEEDEFLIIACDGIWDCLSSQQAIDCVRILLAQGKKLNQVCEEICQLCLAPDTDGGTGVGCDNMTIMVIALLHGKTEEEWYNWVIDRTKNKYGHATPEKLPQLYSEPRMEYARRRRERQIARLQREAETSKKGDETPSLNVSALILGEGSRSTDESNFDDDKSPILGEGSAMDDDSDEDISDDESDHAFPQASGIDVTKSLKEQLEELERDTVDDEAAMGYSELKSEAPPPHLNGDAKYEQSDSDVPGPAAKEGGNFGLE